MARVVFLFLFCPSRIRFSNAVERLAASRTTTTTTVPSVVVVRPGGPGQPKRLRASERRCSRRLCRGTVVNFPPSALTGRRRSYRRRHEPGLRRVRPERVSRRIRVPISATANRRCRRRDKGAFASVRSSPIDNIRYCARLCVDRPLTFATFTAIDRNVVTAITLLSPLSVASGNHFRYVCRGA